MAGFKSTYTCNWVLNQIYNGGALGATLYFAGMTVAPTAAGGGTEWTDAGITRVAKTSNTTNFPTSTAALISNATTLSFGTPVAGTTLVGIAVYDASSGGNFIDFWEFDTPLVVLSGVAFVLPIGSAQGTEV